MSDLARQLATEQRRRLVARIMRKVETVAYPHLAPAERDELRGEILDAIGVYHDLVLDLVKVNRDDVVRNEAVLELLRDIQQMQRQLARD